MSNQRTVLVESISYRGTDGEDHVGVRGEKISVADEGVAHFDFIHNDTPEYRHAQDLKRYAENAKPSKPAARKLSPRDEIVATAIGE